MTQSLVQTIVTLLVVIDPISTAAVFVSVMLVAVMGVTLIGLLMANRIWRVLGLTGANVITRLLGLVLAALATQFVLDRLHARRKPAPP